MATSLTTAALGGYAMQTSSSAQSYAGGGAWGQQGTASWTNAGQYVQGAQAQLYTQHAVDSMMLQTQMRVTIPQQRIYMPQTWSSWMNSDDTSYTTQTVETHDFPQMVWGQWMEHERDQHQQAAYLLNEQGYEEVRRENARREQEYQQAAARYNDPEMIAERERAARERIQKAAEERERKETAEEVAQVLLGELIGGEQLEMYAKTGRILVKGLKNDYLIYKTGKVQRVEKGKLVDLCVYTQQRVTMPETDNVIGLALHIKSDEKDFNKTANASRPIPRPVNLPEAANF